MPLEDGTVATSGDYEQHFYSNGIRYSHNLNPKTGLPLTGIRSVSIVSPNAELSDALCTAVYAMGPATGLHFINQLSEVHCIVIDKKNKSHFSNKINMHG